MFYEKLLGQTFPVNTNKWIYIIMVKNGSIKDEKSKFKKLDMLKTTKLEGISTKVVKEFKYFCYIFC